MNLLPKLTDAKVSQSGFLNKADLISLAKNILKFTAPATAALFALLAQGVPLEKAWPVAAFILYGLVSDYLKTLNNGSK